MYEDYEYTITHSFSCLAKREGKSRLQRQINQMRTAEDVSPTQIKDMEDALDALEQGAFCMGEYHYTLMVYGDTVDEVRKNVASAMAVIGDMGFIASVVTTATEAAFFSQLPANWSYRPRIALLTSLNFTGFSSYHNFMSGKRDGNPWGQALILLKTPSGQPLYMNYQASKDDEDAYDKKLLGNTRLIGMSGAGKTTLLGMFFCQSQKFKPRSPTGYTDVVFDKDRGMELVVRAVGGKYFAIENGKPTGFNPFQLDPTEENIQFLELLVQTLCRGETEAEQLTVNDYDRITKAVEAVMRMEPKEIRRIGLVPQNMTEPADKQRRENSIKKRLMRWCSGGPFAWVFDCPRDELDFTTHSSYGIDGTKFLDNLIVRTPISMYLLYKMDTIIDGRRFIYYMDEAWKWIDDEAFVDFAGDKQLTIRKQNGLGVFSTQMPSSMLNSKIAAHLVQQCATEIYLPNLRADFEEYTTGKGGNRGFGLTVAEYNIVKSLAEDSRMFLLKHGHSSSVAMLDLGGMDDELAILSGSTDNIELLHEIMNEIGSEHPDDWMPIFISKVRARKDRDRLAAVHKPTLS
jgi:type IV secretion/conjugal transfer VirB4 family ATPase